MKVNVLLSTYNGEKYLRTQLESLLSQSAETTICIRDDGSTDGTAELLREYESRERIRVTYGENVGYVSSFFTLLRENGDADAFAFCDQDDEWLPDKLERAAAVLSAAGESVPTLYVGNYDYYDGAMRFVSHHVQPKNIGFENALADCVTPGFCQVMNRALREEIVANIPESACVHDWWVYLVAAARGQVIPDETVTAHYRRHERNASVTGAGFWKLQLWRFRTFFLDGYFNRITAQLREFERLYAAALTAAQRKTLALFTEKNAGTALQKLAYPHRWRQGLADEILLRLCFLLGKL